MECPNCGRQLSPQSERCMTCGKAIPAAQYLLEESGVVPPTASSVTADMSSVSGPTCEPADLGDRLIAAALDHLVIIGMCAWVIAWSVTRWSFVKPSEFRLTAASLLIAVMLSEACAFLYLWLFEAAFEATLGKIIVGLRVVRTVPRGALTACYIRNALRLIDSLGFYMVGGLLARCTQLRRRLGDIAAGTAVVPATFPPGGKALAILVWIAAVVTSVWALPRMSAKPLPSDPPRYFGRSVLQIGSIPGSAYIRSARWRVELQIAPDEPPKNEMSAAAHD